MGESVEVFPPERPWHCSQEVLLNTLKKVSCTFGKGNKLYDAFSGWASQSKSFPPKTLPPNYNTEGTMKPSKELSARRLKKSFRVFFFWGGENFTRRFEILPKPNRFFWCTLS